MLNRYRWFSFSFDDNWSFFINRGTNWFLAMAKRVHISKMFYHTRYHVTFALSRTCAEALSYLMRMRARSYTCAFRFRIVSHRLILYLDHFCITSCFAVCLYIYTRLFPSFIVVPPRFWFHPHPVSPTSSRSESVSSDSEGICRGVKPDRNNFEFG